MKEEEVSKLAGFGIYEDSSIKGHIEETHISWVIITSNYAFKIKKPLKLSFLDFSTIELRKYYCEKEVELNKRFTDIYLSAQPVIRADGKLAIGGGGGEIVDYCVVMKTQSQDRRMDIALKQGSVNLNLIETLARKVALFHKHAVRIYTPFNLSIAKNTFNDILSIKEFVSSTLGTDFSETISNAVSWSDEFLTAHGRRYQERIAEGYKRDLHGDLHAGNIFLYPDPVIFDCIEFNDQFRHIDVLYEVAYLCMDLESGQYKQLAEGFVSAYTNHFPVFSSSEDRSLFNYFKMLRANVRAKVHAISASQEENPDNVLRHSNEVRKYLLLMKDYGAWSD